MTNFPVVKTSSFRFLELHLTLGEMSKSDLSFKLQFTKDNNKIKKTKDIIPIQHLDNFFLPQYNI